MLKICLLTAFIGHLLCWYCDCLITYTPDGRFSAKMLEDNTQLSELMKRMSLKRPMLSIVLGIFALIMSFCGFLSLCEWMRQFSEDKRESYLRTFLGRMLFSGDDVYKPAKVLSGGEKVRCMLSRMMLSGANFLVLDQPTNHLDLESIAALNNGLEAFKYNILFSCHDHQLTQTVANRIIEITDDGIIDRLCTYDEYMHISDLENQARG